MVEYGGGGREKVRKKRKEGREEEREEGVRDRI